MLYKPNARDAAARERVRPVVAISPPTERLDIRDRRDADPRAVAGAEKAAVAERTVRLRTRRRNRASANEEYQPGIVARGLLWVGGVDRDLVETRGEHYRLFNLGLFVILVAAMAAVSFTLYVSTILGDFSWWYLPAAAFWALLIFTLDRAIVAEPLYGDLSLAEMNRRRAARRHQDVRILAQSGGPVEAAVEPVEPRPEPEPAEEVPPQRHRIERLAGYGLRIAISLLIAFLVGEAVLLAVFRPEIQEQFGVQAGASFDSAARIARTAIQGNIAAENKHYSESGNAGKLAAERKKVDRLQQEKDDPDALAQLVPRLADDEADEEKHKHLIDDLQQHIVAIDARNAEQIKLFDPPLAELLQPKPVAGWIEQEKALSAYLARESGDFYISAIPWAVRLILFFIDMLPLILKIATASTIYGNRQSDRATVLRYADAEDVIWACAEIDRRGQLWDKRSKVTFDALSRREDEWLRRRRGFLREQRTRGGPTDE